MYVELLATGFKEANETIDLLQQKREGKDKCDKIYVWY
jgi:hypothetical protein